MAEVIETRLSNGLQVLLKEVHSAPVASTWIWYRVGSRNEVEGATGLSHWVEHMLFKGSSRFPKGAIMRAVNRHGGYLNAMTSYDFTAYYETLPAAQAELALQIEADRMTTALFDHQEVEAERTVIIAEREGSENEPRYVLSEELVAAAFRVHPYHHQPVGWKADLRAITREQLYDHYRRHYGPNNAVLIVVGDVDAQEHLALIERYFGGIAPVEPLAPVAREEPPQRGERRVTVRMPGSAPIVRISYHTPPVAHPDYVPLVVMDAVLSGGKAMFAFGDSPARSARLYRALVETELASSASSNYHPSLDPFLFSLGATVRDGRTPTEVEAALLAEMARLQEEPVEERELRVAIRQTQAQFAYNSESASDQALAMGFLEMVDDHHRMDGLLGELAAVTPEDVLRVARAYLGEDNRVVGWFVPEGDGASGTRQGLSARKGVAHAVLPPPVAYYRPPVRDLPISPESVVRETLENGIVVLVKENAASPSVSVEGTVQAGNLYEEDAKAGLANLTASMLRRGTERHTFQELNALLDDVGASLSVYAGRDDAGFDGRALADDLGLLIDTLAEVLTLPSFAPAELEKLRGQLLTRLGVAEMDTGYRANIAFDAALYPSGHPYARPLAGTRDTVAALTRDELVAFYRAHYHPASLVLCVVGAVRAGDVVERVARALGDWRPPSTPDVRDVPPVTPRSEPTQVRVPLPGKAQVDLIWGALGMPRTSPDYYAAQVANLILGRLGLMGRLGANVRDKLGLAYYVSSVLQVGPGPHPWNVVAGVNPGDIERATAAILDEIRTMREALVGEEELEDSKTYLNGALPLHLETNDGISSLLLDIEQYGLGYDYLQRYPDIIGAVTREEVQRVVRRYLDPERAVLAMAGTFDGRA